MADTRSFLVMESQRGNIKISEDVIAVVASKAASEIEGVHSLHRIKSKDFKIAGGYNNQFGITVVIKDNQLNINAEVIAKAGVMIAQLGRELQRSITAAIESACGIHPASVNIRIAGVKE